MDIGTTEEHKSSTRGMGANFMSRGPNEQNTHGLRTENKNSRKSISKMNQMPFI